MPNSNRLNIFGKSKSIQFLFGRRSYERLHRKSVFLALSDELPCREPCNFSFKAGKGKKRLVAYSSLSLHSSDGIAQW